jgi:hypothetical protein
VLYPAREAGTVSLDHPKSETFERFKEFAEMIINNYNIKIKVIKSDLTLLFPLPSSLLSFLKISFKK